MNPAAFEQVFSVPFRHLWSTNFSGDQTANEVRPLGLARFVGDEPNALLKYFASAQSDRLANLESQLPIVLFGPAGTGKTSLALTIVTDLAERTESDSEFNDVIPLQIRNTEITSSLKPVFLTALDFDRRYRTALDTDSIEDFRNRLVQASGLVVDDLHRLAGKFSAQNEFISILDEMRRKNRPIIVTLDVSPQLCTGLSPQLVSRLSGGLSLPVNPPGPSARLEIIRDLAKINEINLTQDAAKLLVDRLSVTVPKLDHVFAQIKTALKAKKEDPLQPVDAATLTRIFKKSSADMEKLSQLIIKLVAAEFKLKVSELKSNSRKQSIVLARGVSIYLNRNLLGTSFLKIGSYLGGRDHSTIMHAYQKIKTLIGNEENKDAGSVRISVEKLQQQLAEQFASQINFI